MARIHCKTTGSAQNSGSTDTDAASLTGTDASVTGAVVDLSVDAPDLSGLITSGVNQSSIYIEDATNANRKIFWITAFDNVAKTVTVDVAPTGTITASVWNIGGRVVLTNAVQEGALRAGDEFIFHDSPATANAVRWTFRTAGNTTDGFAKVISDGTAYFQIVATGTTAVFDGATAMQWIEGLEIIQQGASGIAYSPSGNNCVMFDCKFTDSGDATFNAQNNGFKIIGCEFSGSIGDAIQYNGATNTVIWGCYIHDNGRDGIRTGAVTSMSNIVAFCIIESNAGRGMFTESGAPTTTTTQQGLIAQNTVYGNNDSGYEVNDVDYRPVLIGNIFKDNGNAAGEFNIDYPAAVVGLFSAFNFFNADGGRGGGNVNNFTPSSLDSTADPLFTSAAGGDFSLQAASPARNFGFPGVFLGSASTGFLSSGAVQPDATALPPTPAMTGNIGKRCLYPGWK